MRSYYQQLHGRVMNNLRANAFQHLKTGTTSRVWTSIDGEEIWFESDDLVLEPSAESLATLWLIPALLTGRNLELEQKLCPTWHDNAHKAMEFLEKYWGDRPVEIIADRLEHDSMQRAQSNSDKTGLFFTCGTDSFHALLTNPKPDFLVYVETFDIPGDQTRAKIARQRVEKIAAAFGSHAVIVRTNAKKHPTFSKHRLSDTHSSFLAAVGHLLAPHMASITIAPSWHKSHHLVTGSNWQLDPLWSSQSFRIVHAEASAQRFERVKAICDNRLAQQNLHVCFQNYNCSSCEKCVRTMVELMISGKLRQFETFDHTIELTERIDSLSRISHPIFFEAALNKGLDAKLEEAIIRLFRRNAQFQSSIEAQLKQQRYVDEQFPKLKEGLDNALHHYSLLQAEHARLSADYDALVGNLPIKSGITFVRKVAKKLRKSRTNRGLSHD